MGSLPPGSRSMLVPIAGSLLLSLLVGIFVPLSAQSNSTWTDGTGNWSNPLNWDNGVPNGNYNASINYISSIGPTTVSLDVNATVNNLAIASGETLAFLPGNTLTVQAGGSINDSGTISLAGGSIIGATGTETLFVDHTTGGVVGPGTIDMNVWIGIGPFDGIVVNQGDALTITGNVQTNSDTWGISVRSGGSLTIGGSLRSTGDNQVVGGTMTVKGDLSNGVGGNVVVLNVANGGILNVNGTLDNTGFAHIINASGGSVVQVGEGFNLSNYAQAYFDGGSTLSVKGNLNILGNEVPPVLTNVSFTNGSTFTVQKDLNNSGILSLATGSAGTVSGALNNSGAVQIDPTSVLTVKSGFNQTAGSTLVDGILSAQGTGVNLAGGTLAGTGIINGNVTNSGTLSPGDAPGVLTINGNYTQTSTGTLLEQVCWIPGCTVSQLQVNGVANLNGTLAFSFLDNYDPTVGESFILMTFLHEYGSFNTITGLNLGNNEYLELFYDPHDVRVEVKTPEPGSALLLLVGALALLAISYRRVAI